VFPSSIEDGGNEAISSFVLSTDDCWVVSKALVVSASNDETVAISTQTKHKIVFFIARNY
jgi:hypothetical protein